MLDKNARQKCSTKMLRNNARKNARQKCSTITLEKMLEKNGGKKRLPPFGKFLKVCKEEQEEFSQENALRPGLLAELENGTAQ
jgi:hypothetical protein